MRARGKRIYNYLLTQLQQPSTWRGFVLLVSGAGAFISEEAKEGIVAVGIFIAGLIGTTFPDKLDKKKDSTDAEL